MVYRIRRHEGLAANVFSAEKVHPGKGLYKIQYVLNDLDLLSGNNPSEVIVYLMGMLERAIQHA